ncbi:hypothetical protein [Streptosporangium sp. NPDC002524]|uniref:hypothetical protein n=1 Tax=Streptosporangium sp. NPDC002524 TaxID=3154537 RepID=UPI00332AFF15
MEQHNGSDQSSARNAPDFDEHCPAYTMTGDLPRMFALVQEFYEEGEGEDDGESVTEVVAYGLTLPGGTAAIVGANGHGFGRWTSAHSAARRLHSDLVWLGGGSWDRTSQRPPET